MNFSTKKEDEKKTKQLYEPMDGKRVPIGPATEAALNGDIVLGTVEITGPGTRTLYIVHRPIASKQRKAAAHNQTEVSVNTLADYKKLLAKAGKATQEQKDKPPFASFLYNLVVPYVSGILLKQFLELFEEQDKPEQHAVPEPAFGVHKQAHKIATLILADEEPEKVSTAMVEPLKRYATALKGDRDQLRAGCAAGIYTAYFSYVKISRMDRKKNLESIEKAKKRLRAFEDEPPEAIQLWKNQNPGKIRRAPTIPPALVSDEDLDMWDCMHQVIDAAEAAVKIYMPTTSDAEKERVDRIPGQTVLNEHALNNYESMGLKGLLTGATREENDDEEETVDKPSTAAEKDAPVEKEEEDLEEA